MLTALLTASDSLISHVKSGSDQPSSVDNPGTSAFSVA